MEIWRMCISCRKTNATDTHSEYVILIAFSPQQSLQERASMLVLRTLSLFLLLLDRSCNLVKPLNITFHEKPSSVFRVVSFRTDGWIS